MEAVEYLLKAAGSVGDLTCSKIGQIQGIMTRSRMLALNATIESARAGDAGRGFGIVANEMKDISNEISELATSLQGELKGELSKLGNHAAFASEQLRKVRGERLADLAHNVVEIADRNLFERTCDVRWWATDQAVVECAEAPADAQKQQYASRRLGVILNSYTVYLDICIADRHGRVISNGRPDRYPGAIGRDVSKQSWFIDAMHTASGDDFAVADIASEPLLEGAITATYSTAIRAGGEEHGEVLGVLGIFFDWSSQAQAIVDGVRLAPEERGRSRCLIVDSNHRIIASSDGAGGLGATFPIDTAQGPQGHYTIDNSMLVGYARTPGYETYRGLGWYGVISQWE